MKSSERFNIIKTYMKINKLKKTKDGIEWFLEYRNDSKLYRIKKFSNINISNESFEQFLSEIRNIGIDFSECPDIYDDINLSVDIIYDSLLLLEDVFIFGSIREDKLKEQFSIYFIRSVSTEEYFKQNLHKWA